MSRDRMLNVAQRDAQDAALRRAQRVFGGPGASVEPSAARYTRWHRQTELARLWPELHAELMAAIGLQPSGQPLRRGRP